LPKPTCPLVLPEIDEYKPTESGEPPLGRAQNWNYKGQLAVRAEHHARLGRLQLVLPALHGPAPNDAAFVGEEAEQYWGTVDLYMGGAEHATGHLLYARFWYLFLKDLGWLAGMSPFPETD
jgi:leucyl-tRNA synthetase